MCSVIRHLLVLSIFCTIGLTSNAQESYPRQCAALCLEHSNGWVAITREPFKDLCIRMWSSLKSYTKKEREEEAKLAMEYINLSGPYKALDCLNKNFAASQPVDAPQRSSANSTTEVRSRDTQQRTDQSQQSSQQNQATQQQSQQAQQQAQQARAAQQQSQQAVFNSAQNQTAADQTRKSERRRHEPENEAHDCLSLDKSGLFGGIVNKCDFKVAYQFCNFNPKKDSWAESHTCGKSGGADFVGAGRTSAAHVKNTETVYWFACKDPAWPVDVEYVAGKGIQARCYTIGGK